MNKHSENSIHLDWAPELFKKRKITSLDELSTYLHVTTFLEEELKGELDISFFLWKRSLQFASVLYLPDVLVDPYTRGTVWPTDPTLFEQNIKLGYVPLSPGDLVQYKLFAAAFLAHQAIYVGQGYIVELVRVTESPKPLGHITIRKLTDMFVRGGKETKVDFISFSKQEHASSITRSEVLRRCLSSIGYYRYNLISFNCLTAVVAFYNPNDLDTASGNNSSMEGVTNAVFYTALLIIIGSLISLVFFVLFIHCLIQKQNRNGIKCYSCASTFGKVQKKNL